MVEVVYILCALTSLTCAALLLRAYAQNRVRLLLWSGLCFAGMAINNIFLVFDVSIWPDTGLSIFRSIPAFVGLVFLLYGLIWDAK